MIAAGYTHETLVAIESNPGLKSRFPNIITFEDYSMNELAKIMDLMVKKRGLYMDEDVRNKAINILEQRKSSSSETDFGNAREVRNIVHEAEAALALRLVREKKMPNKGQKVDPREILTLRKEDLDPIKTDLPRRRLDM